MQVQPIYFSNGLLATSKIFVTDGPGQTKKFNFFSFWPREGGGIDHNQKMVENNYLAVTNTQCLFHLEVTFLFYVQLWNCDHYQWGILGQFYYLQLLPCKSDFPWVGRPVGQENQSAWDLPTSCGEPSGLVGVTS